MRKNLAPKASRSPEKDGPNRRNAMIAPREATKAVRLAVALAAGEVVSAAPVVTSTMSHVVQPPGKPR